MQGASGRKSNKQQVTNTDTELRMEDANIHPMELSGDQNQEQSILATYTNHTKANFLLTVTTIIKTTIGVGIIAFPYTISTLGYVFAPMLLVMFFALNQFASILLIKSKNLAKHSNYSTIMQQIWPSEYSQIFGSSVIFMDNIGTCILQFILIKTTVRKVALEMSNDPTLIDRFYFSQWFIVLTVGLAIFPFVLIKKIESLRIFAFIGLISIVVFVTGVILIYAKNQINQAIISQMHAFPQNWLKAASAAVTIVLSFNFQTNFFPIYKSMKDVNDKRFAWACFTGILGCAIPYLTVGFLGYALVGDSAANFLLSLPYSKIHPILFYMTNISYVFSLLFAIVLMFFSCRNNFINIVKRIIKKIMTRQSDPLFQQSAIDSEFYMLSKRQKIKRANRLYYICTIFLYAVILALSTNLTSIELIFNFLGAICESLLAVLLPCFFYIMLIRKRQQKKRFIYYFAIAVIIVMVPYCIFSIVASYLPQN